jgi:WD40 repeat protein
LPPVLSAANITLNRNGSRILVSTYPAGQVVTLLDATGQVLATTEGMFSDLHPSGTRFVTAEGYNTGQVSVWDDSGKQVARFLAHRNQVLSVGYTPDGRYLVTTGCDAEITFAMVCEAPSTRFWAFDDQLAADLINNGEETLSLHAAPDGEHLLTIECNHYFTELGSPDKCFPNTPHQRMGVVWDLKTGEEASLGMGGGYTIAAKFTAASDNVMLLECDPGTNFDSCIKPRLTYYNLDGQPTGQVADPHLAAISTGDFTPDGQHLLFLNANPGPGSSLSNGDQLAPLYLWNIEADQWIPTGSIQNHFTWVALSPDEQHFAAMDEDRREVSLWDLEGQLVITATLGKEDVDPRDVWGRFSPDGKWIVLGACTMVRMGHCDDATAFLWDLTTNQVNSFQAGTGRIASLEFSPDSQYLVIVNSNDKLVQLWSISDAETLRLRATLTGFTGAPLLSAFRHQGDRLLTAHADGSVWLWDLEGNTLGVIKAYGGSLSLAGFSGDGAKIIAVSCDAVSPETGSCAQERIRAWSLWQDPKEMLAEADTRLGARDFTVEECQSYLRSYDCP